MIEWAPLFSKNSWEKIQSNKCPLTVSQPFLTVWWTSSCGSWLLGIPWMGRSISGVKRVIVKTLFLSCNLTCYLFNRLLLYSDSHSSMMIFFIKYFDNMNQVIIKIRGSFNSSNIYSIYHFNFWSNKQSNSFNWLLFESTIDFFLQKFKTSY